MIKEVLESIEFQDKAKIVFKEWLEFYGLSRFITWRSLAFELLAKISPMANISISVEILSTKGTYDRKTSVVGISDMTLESIEEHRLPDVLIEVSKTGFTQLILGCLEELKTDSEFRELVMYDVYKDFYDEMNKGKKVEVAPNISSQRLIEIIEPYFKIFGVEDGQ